VEIKLNKLIYPLFVKQEEKLREKILSMPGVYRFSPDTLIKEVLQLKKLGIKNVLIFGVPKQKDWKGTFAYKERDIVSQAVRLIKSTAPQITVFTDVCLCAYTSHAHCGVIKKGMTKIDSSATLNALSRMAIEHARAGADYVAPSAMAKRQVQVIRRALNREGFRHVKIMGYSAKFASNFYGPFRDVADSAPKFGDREGYQLDYAKTKDALTEIKQDIKEGVDIVMIKPALSYLDIIKEAKDRFDNPLAVYNVSGEYSMIKKGAKAGFWDEEKIVFEIISSIKRAGADYIITYHAKDIARWLNR